MRILHKLISSTIGTCTFHFRGKVMMALAPYFSRRMAFYLVIHWLHKASRAKGLSVDRMKVLTLIDYMGIDPYKTGEDRPAVTLFEVPDGK